MENQIQDALREVASAQDFVRVTVDGGWVHVSVYAPDKTAYVLFCFEPSGKMFGSAYTLKDSTLEHRVVFHGTWENDTWENEKEREDEQG